MKESFRVELENLINCYSIDTYCETPDFVLTEYLCEQIEAYRNLTLAREKWFGRAPEDAQLEQPPPERRR